MATKEVLILVSKSESRTKVAVVKAQNRHDGVRRSIDMLGINPVDGKNVLLKPNFNTADPYPASSNIDTVRELVLY
ncbi:MAG: hypothetical protein ACLFS8_07935, partial [Clostridia bacterium]